MRIDIVVVYVPRYERGHGVHFVPPITGIHLAALTPPGHDVRVVHQQTLPPGDRTAILDTDAQLVALSFFSGFADEAWALAAALRARGKQVVAGGPHVSFQPDEALQHCDAIVVGEAEAAWPRLVHDAAAGRLRPRYDGSAAPLQGLPTPRYDLLPRRFFVPRVIQATRGCPFRCSFCTVPTLNPGFRTRPVADVLRDVAHEEPGWTWWQRKVAWFWDDNLTADRKYVKSLLRQMIPLDRWWLTQASIDICRDEELLDLMEQSGCIGIFLGIESLHAPSLRAANKRQNRVEQYAAAIEKLHARGICVMAGFIAGFDHDDAEGVVAMADQLQQIGVDVPFLSVLTPFAGTPLWDQLQAQGRLLEDRGWPFYNGYNVAFQPQLMSPDQLYQAHRELWRRAFSPRAVAARMARARGQLRTGAFLMAGTMNAFYGGKRLAGNLPVDVRPQPGAWRNPSVPTAPPLRVAASATQPAPAPPLIDAPAAAR